MNFSFLYLRLLLPESRLKPVITTFPPPESLSIFLSHLISYPLLSVVQPSSHLQHCFFPPGQFLDLARIRAPLTPLLSYIYQPSRLISLCSLHNIHPSLKTSTWPVACQTSFHFTPQQHLTCLVPPFPWLWCPYYSCDYSFLVPFVGLTFFT